jgi:tRNA(Ile)-lysidine synthase
MVACGHLPRLYAGVVPDGVASIRALVARRLAERGLRRALIAYSGGPDSTALADAAAATLGPAAVVLLHVDHGAPASGDARAHAERWAAERGIELRVARIDVPAGASWEAQARVARYRALHQLAGTGELVATAHTASDQAETVLLQMIRGTGPAGLAGIARRRGAIWRPLLDVSRAEIEDYVIDAGLGTWRDPMNTDARFDRARVRAEVLPLLRTLNPEAEAALCRLADAAAEQRAVLDHAASRLLREAQAIGGALLAAPLAAAPAAVAKHALATWWRSRGRPGLAAAHLDAVLALARAPDAGTRGLDLPGGRVERVYGELRLLTAPTSVGPTPRRVIAEGPDGPYHVRTWRPGDRMAPARLRGRHRKLSDLFTDARVPRADRPHAVVIERADGTIAWAEHVGAAFGVEIHVIGV